jgi:hypothetical protein
MITLRCGRFLMTEAEVLALVSFGIHSQDT